MLAPLSWLRDFAPLDASVDHLTDTLSNLGLVVESVARVGGGLDGVVVARVLAIRPHPGADRIRLVDVDAGAGDAVQIACGAWNFATGDLVPLATVGTALPGGTEIARRQIRGEWSNGMLCAPGELGLPEPAGEGGLMVLRPGLAPPGTPVADALGLAADVVFDLEVSPNRPDALSMAGIARDLAAGLGEPFVLPALPGSATAVAPGIEVAGVEVLDGDLCPRFTATVVADVPAGHSPPWVSRRLTLAGMRPISAVVDASNYVMLDLGQPNHAYDLDKLDGRGLLVRRARPGESLTTLDGVIRRLGPEDCLVCDARGGPVGIGGIMGGESSEVDATTTTVVLECAWFAPTAVARTGNRLGLASDARHRFERGVDPDIADRAVGRFVTLLGGARRGPTTDRRSPAHLPAPRRLAVRTARVNAVLGTTLAGTKVADLLGPLGFDVAAGPGGVCDVQVPSWRPDTCREIDVIEEVARRYGYSRIQRTLPPGSRAGGGLSRFQRERRRVREILAGAGVSEAWTTTFLAPGDLGAAGLATEAVEVENPLDRAESVLRTSLLPGLLKAVRANADRQMPDVRLFEIGRVFLPPGAGDVLPIEREEVAAILAGEGADAPRAARLVTVLAGALRLETLDLVAGPVPGLHPTRSALLRGPGGTAVGSVGEVAADVVAAYGLAGRVGFWQADLAALVGLARRDALAQPVSRFPASDLDLAFVVPGDVPAAAVAATLRAGAGDLVESLRLFDVFALPAAGHGARSLAFRMRLRSPDRTLTDRDVASARQGAIASVAAAHRATLRGA
ncbi:MAG: phenylalanine--tRNA ligase subunit beta [Acidimicrobiales bacterium]